MRARSSFRQPLTGHRSRSSFTLIELLVVIAIIAILAGLTLGVSGYVNGKAGRSRAQAEIAAVETALERFKIDNGAYPDMSGNNLISGTNYSTTANSTAYKATAGILLTNLWGGKTATNATPTSTIYMEFKKGQIGGTSTNIYLQDPFGSAYGYAAGSNAYFNTNFVDLWSLGQTTTNTVQWVSNWKAN